MEEDIHDLFLKVRCLNFFHVPTKGRLINETGGGNDKQLKGGWFAALAAWLSALKAKWDEYMAQRKLRRDAKKIKKKLKSSKVQDLSKHEASTIQNLNATEMDDTNGFSKSKKNESNINLKNSSKALVDTNTNNNKAAVESGKEQKKVIVEKVKKVQENELSYLDDSSFILGSSPMKLQLTNRIYDAKSGNVILFKIDDELISKANAELDEKYEKEIERMEEKMMKGSSAKRPRVIKKNELMESILYEYESNGKKTFNYLNDIDQKRGELTVSNILMSE